MTSEQTPRLEPKPWETLAAFCSRLDVPLAPLKGYEFAADNIHNSLAKHPRLGEFVWDPSARVEIGDAVSVGCWVF